MRDLFSRAIKTSDMAFIMKEFAEGTKTGNFSKKFSDPKRSKLMEKQIRGVIELEEAGKYTGHYFNILTRHSNGERIGFIWLMVTPSPQGEPALEIRALGITKQFRGKGYASMILNDFIDSNVHHPFQAKCFAKSTKMIEMLKRRGFTVFSTSPTGSTFLVRKPTLV